MPAVTSTPATVSSNSSSTQKKYSTITGGLSQLSGRSGTSAATSGPSGLSKRASVKGLFDDGSDAVQSNNGSEFTTASGRRIVTAQGAGVGVGREDGPWSVSVADASAATDNSTKVREPRKKQKVLSPMFTLYITTPTHNLTLLRSTTELVDLDAKLRESHPTVPVLPQLPNAAGANSPTSQSQTSRKILQTISRTLSPNANKTRAALSNLTASGHALAEPNGSATSPVRNKANATASSATPPKNEVEDAKAPTALLANYLTTISNLATVRRHKAWRRFIRVGAEDLESVRVERRVRKVRSDLAQHVKMSVAPTNTNVGATPSQSDIGEEGGRTDDDRSISGRSTSHSYTGSRQGRERPEVPTRSTSVDPERQAQTVDGAAAAAAAKKGSNFAGIPEEMEREKQAATEESWTEKDGPESRSAKKSSSSSKEVEKRERKARRYNRNEAEKVTVDDFEMIRVLGKGCAGKVLLVRHSPTRGLFAMKSIHKRHVLAHQELQHTLTEQAVLKRMAKEVMDPFVVKLWWSFHDKNNLYLVMDFHPGGDLATQLSRWGRLGRDRARFYAAEIVEGVEGLHRAGVIYRDLKPENVLIGSDGHIVLSDFGLSKEFPVRDLGGSSTPPPGSPSKSYSSRDVKSSGGGGHTPHWLSASEDGRSTSSTSSIDNAYPHAVKSRNRWADERDTTTTFCGTAEYLAPEVIQGAAYSYEVDWWSFGTMLYEMLTGITPFWADTHAEMYVRVLHDDLTFPDDRVLDQDTKSILRGLLQRNPMLRMKEPRIKRHPYFSMIEWAHVFHKRYIPPYIPPINPLDETDTQNFDEAFLDMQPVVNGADDADDFGEDPSLQGQTQVDGDTTVGSNNVIGSNDAGASGKRQGDQHASDAADGKSLFDGYSFHGRRDSESVQSSIMSFDALSNGGERTKKDSMVSEKTAASPRAAATTAANTGTPASPAFSSTTAASSPPAAAVAAATSTAPVAPSAAPTAPVTVDPYEEDEEDDESAARAAVAALAHLESEAALADISNGDSTVTSMPSERSVDSSTSQLTSEPAQAANEPSKTGSSAAKVARRGPASSGLPAHATIAEADGDDEEEADEDWDMIDAPASDAMQSELNGGKGQNLFARGVVDTYRLLRRQDSSRVPASPSYSSSSSRPFNRLSRRQVSSRRNLKVNNNNDASRLTSGSAASLASSNAKSGAEDETPEVERDAPLATSATINEEDGEDAAAAAGGGNGNLPSLTTGTTSADSAQQNGNSAKPASSTARQRKAGSPSVASSDDLPANSGNKARLKKIKRFTSFFENAGR